MPFNQTSLRPDKKKNKNGEPVETVTRGGQVVNDLVKRCANWVRSFKSEGWGGGEARRRRRVHFNQHQEQMSSSAAGVKGQWC